MTQQILILFPEETIYGTFYRPVNHHSKLAAQIVGSSVIPADRLPILIEFGCRIEIQRTQVIPFKVDYDKVRRIGQIEVTP